MSANDGRRAGFFRETGVEQQVDTVTDTDLRLSGWVEPCAVGT